MNQPLSGSSLGGDQVLGDPFDVADYHDQVERIQRGLITGTLEFNAPKPVIIGEVPEDEREAFDNLAWVAAFRYFDQQEGPSMYRPTRGGIGLNLNSTQAEYLIPGTYAQVADDLGRVGLGANREEFSNKYEQVAVRAGESPRSISVWHVQPQSRPDQIRPQYLASNREGMTTQSYVGRARLNRAPAPVDSKYQAIMLVDQSSLGANTGVTALPPYAIGRYGPLVIHRSPSANKAGARSLWVSQSDPALV